MQPRSKHDRHQAVTKEVDNLTKPLLDGVLRQPCLRPGARADGRNGHRPKVLNFGAAIDNFALFS